MKLFVKFSAFFLMVAMLFTFTVTTSFAKTSDANSATLHASGVSKFYDPTIGAYISPFKMTDHGLVPVSKKEYENSKKPITVNTSSSTETNSIGNNSIVDTTTGNNVISPNEIDYRYWEYYEDSATTYYGNAIQVDAGIICSTPTCHIGTSNTATVSKSYSTSTSSEISAINTGATFSITTATSSTTSYVWDLVQGDSGYIAFEPHKRKSTGTLIEWSSIFGQVASKSAYARSAIKLSDGHADGYYLFVYTS